MQKYSPLILSLLLISCSSNPEITRIGPGIIKSEEQLISKEQLKKDETKKDVLTGAGIGAGSGAAVGAGSGAMAGAMIGGVIGIIGGGICTIITLGLGAVPCFAGTVGGGMALGAGVGAGTGALVGAGTGALVGAGGGYIYVSNKDDIIGKYKYEVLEDGKTLPITFEQFPDRNYSVGQKVDIYTSKYKGEKTYFIKAIQQDSKED
ncbi:glycine-zipper containing OmpA-like membrane domain protein [Francisella tularensis subsp. novicida U112]|uniref:Glycine zipper family protein n=2 Tax=Francisella tularensis TaxID=263 RepID=A0A6I4RN00_FRATU|nr:hypothetical protein [Francisella tularensis]ABK89049.1 hypothetical membrane protein [Francisella tularensis subsp. novicida U112]AJI61023.1 glycine-zipper containing OmpA-like membrane domain protein [Francisella tularensis subsp. novicida U112]MWZ39734.1 hypothetical protein [Francisella tularensis]